MCVCVGGGRLLIIQHGDEMAVTVIRMVCTSREQYYVYNIRYF